MRRTRLFCVLVGLLLELGCDSPQEPSAAAVVSRAKSASRAIASVPSPVPSISPAALKETAAIGEMGEWIDAKLYRFRVGRIARCEDKRPDKDSAGVVRLGVAVEISARADNVLAAPRDVTLSHAGVIVNSLIVTSAPKACQPLMQPTTLQEGQSTSGFVLFDAPDIEFARSSVLGYRPARWGGAPLAEVKLPACLDDCPKKAKP
jgi:hypothetical protein